MQKIKILVEIFNGYYEQRAVKDAIAKHAFVAAIKAAKLLPAGTKYEEEKKAELIKLLSSMTGDPDKKVNDNDDTLVSTDELCESKAGEIADPVIGIGDGIDTTQGETYSEKIPESDVDEIAGPYVDEIPEPDVDEIAGPDVDEIADPVEQIVEASEVAETDENAQNGEIAG